MKNLTKLNIRLRWYWNTHSPTWKIRAFLKSTSEEAPKNKSKIQMKNWFCLLSMKTLYIAGQWWTRCQWTKTTQHQSDVRYTNMKMLMVKRHIMYIFSKILNGKKSITFAKWKAKTSIWKMTRSSTCCRSLWTLMILLEDKLSNLEYILQNSAVR